MKSNTPNRSVLIAFAMTVLFGGNNAIAVRYSDADMPPFYAAAIRFAIAAIILYSLAAIFHLRLPRGKALLGAVLFGLLGCGLNFALMYWALESLHPGLSMVILALVPLMTFIFACAQKQEVFHWKAIGGSLLAMGGIGVIVWNQMGIKAPLLPVLAVLASAVCYAEANIVLKAFPHSHPITTNAIALTTGSVLLSMMSAVRGETPCLPSGPGTWIALIYLIVFGSVIAFGLSVYVTQHWTASASSYQFVLFPIVTIAVSAWLTHESVGPALILGAVLVLGGVYIGGIARTIKLPKINPAALVCGEEPCPDCV